MQRAAEMGKAFKRYWWIPANPDCRWLGDLRWTPGESPKLELIYRTADERTASPPLDGSESMLGIDAKGNLISVLRVGCTGGTSSGFLSTREYEGGHILKGIHATKRDAFRMHRFNLHLQYLGDWLHEEGFVEPNQAQDDFEVRYSRPPDRQFEISRGISLNIAHYGESSVSSRQRSMEYDIFFSMEKSHSFNWKQAFRSMDALRTLIHFACLRRIKPTKICFEKLDHTLAVGDRRLPKEIEVFNGSLSLPAAKQLHEQDFVFMFHDVAGRFADFCNRWFKFCIEQREALACYHATVYLNLPDELRLISITQALEAYHQEAYRPQNATRFRDRIRDLCTIHHKRMEPFVGSADQFATIVTDTRDFYTHHHPAIRNRGTVATGTKLTTMSYHLQFLFRLCVLTTFGVDKDPYGLLTRRIPARMIEY